MTAPALAAGGGSPATKPGTGAGTGPATTASPSARPHPGKPSLDRRHFLLPHPHRGDTPLGYVEGTNRPQTSDGLPNPIAGPASPLLAAFRVTSRYAKWQVSPGVTATEWTQTDQRGPVRLYLLAVKYRTPGVRVDTMNNGPVRSVGTVLHMTRRAHAIAGVNGDFYDIGVTGAPIGIDKNSRRGLLDGRLDGWNAAFSLDQQGTPHIGTVRVHTQISGHPGIRVRTYNTPGIPSDSIGLYDRRFGASAGSLITHDETRDLRVVHLVHGRVVSSGHHLPSYGAPIKGRMLVGRGAGARSLAALHVGVHVRITTTMTGYPRVVLTGSQFLIKNGLMAVNDDREMAPRTAVGIDDDTHEILILSVDGRQKTSRGYTMDELAHEMMDLGADSALNLDGGGSTTMVARRGASPLSVLNVPSDGFPRSVADGLAVDYSPAAARRERQRARARHRAARKPGHHSHHSHHSHHHR